MSKLFACESSSSQVHINVPADLYFSQPDLNPYLYPAQISSPIDRLAIEVALSFLKILTKILKNACVAGLKEILDPDLNQN